MAISRLARNPVGLSTNACTTARPVVRCRSKVVEAERTSEEKLSTRGSFASLSANKLGTQQVKELERPLAEYMSLPASQYSVLDARKIERISDTTFRCYVGQLRMFQWSAEPVLTVSVNVDPEGCTIRLLSCELKGSSIVEEINSRFQAQMTNVVRWRDGPSEAPEAKEITSDTTLQVDIEVPRWCAFLPTSQIERVGSKVLQNVLNIMVPTFLKQLAKDYQLWASGDESRMPVGEL